MSDTPTRVYTQGQLTVEWYPERCVHCENCVQSLPEVFNIEARPWIDVTKADADKIVAVCNACPSKAIVGDLAS